MPHSCEMSVNSKIQKYSDTVNLPGLDPKNYFSDSDGVGVLEHGEAGSESFRLIRHLQVGQTAHGLGRGWSPVGSVYGETNIFKTQMFFFRGGNTGKSPVG